MSLNPNAISKIRVSPFCDLLMCVKTAGRVTNSVDPEQCRPCILQHLVWVCTVCSGLSVPILRIIVVITCKYSGI